MAKPTADSIVLDYLDLKDIISRIKSLCTNFIIDADHHNIGYMVGTDLPVDRFLILDVTGTGVDSFAGYSIVPEEFIRLAKDIRKTKSASMYNELTQTLTIVSDMNAYRNGRECSLLKFQRIPDMRNVTREYNVLFKNKEITEAAFAAVEDSFESPEWLTVSEVDFESIINKNAVTLYIGEHPIIVSKALFGQMKKTERLQYRLLMEDSDTFLVLFRQTEPMFDMYTLVRFLVYYQL